MIIDINDVCTCCSLFIPFGTSILLTKIHPKLVSAIKAAIIVDNDLDCYRHTDNSSYFCNTCYVIIFERQILKFGSTNCINILPFQKYPNVFSDLTLVITTFIILAHPVMSVINLRPSRFCLTTFYYRI